MAENLKVTHWRNPNYGATNETGFNAIPAGMRSNSGYFTEGGMNAYFWSLSESNAYSGYAYLLSYGHSEMIRYGKDKQLGFSVRCVKDPSK